MIVIAIKVHPQKSCRKYSTASLTTWNFITVQSNRSMFKIVNKHCAIFKTSIKRTPFIKLTLG